MILTEKSSSKIQVLRGLAIIAVVFIHNTPLGLAQVWCKPFLNYAVGLFLFLSGMLSDVEKWRPLKRIMKVIIPYLIWSFVYVAIENFSNIRNLPLLYVKSLLTANSASIMYYVFVYCELTLLIPVIDKLSRSKIKWVGFMVSPLEIIFMRLFPLIWGLEINNYVTMIMHISCVGWFTYFYLGYLIGNKRIELKNALPPPFLWIILTILWVVAVILQVLEGYWYLSMGEQNCGTQLKISAIFTSIVFMLLAYNYIIDDKLPLNKYMIVLGNKSFGIYFCHLAIMAGLEKIPNYKVIAIYPLNAVITIILSLICVILGGKLLGRFAKYFAF